MWVGEVYVGTKVNDPSTIMHEMGHFLDWKIFSSQNPFQGPASAYGKLGKAIYNDIRRTATEQGLWDQIINTINATKNDPRRRAVNDAITSFFDAMMLGKGKLYCGHSQSYFASDPDNAHHEVFAHFFELYASNQKQAIELLRKFYPDTVRELEDVLGR
jgi:hypothetical protein